MGILRFDPSGTFHGSTGISNDDLLGISERLDTARQATLDDLRDWHAKVEVPQEKEPLDAAFMDLPERILDAYEEQREASELGRILAATRTLREKVDRVVVLGIGGSYMGARALMESCCHPYHNQLSRAERGSYPRIYFAGNNLDNDAMQGLLGLLNQQSQEATDPVQKKWGLVVISKSGGTLETAVALRVLYSALVESCGGDEKEAAELFIPVTGSSGKLFNWSEKSGFVDRFEVPEGVGGRFSVLSAVGLVPAALLGIDVVKLLRGAADMSEHYRSAAVSENAVLQFVGTGHLLEAERGATIRIMNVWSDALEATGFWYDQLLSESLGKKLQGATPITAVNTRDLHSRAQQHQEGRRDKWINNVIIERAREDAIKLPRLDNDEDQLNKFADKPVFQMLDAAIQGTNESYAQDGRPASNLFLPEISETYIGQLLQLLMLATAAEGRLIGINPYGQPGVQLYKSNMNRILEI